jgi:hypothetical protein
MPTALVDIAGDVARQFSRDGVAVQVRDVDETADRVDLALDLSAAECPDCVMPGEYLQRLIASGLTEVAHRPVAVTLDDPRTTVESAQAEPLGEMVTILDPAALATAGGDVDRGPDAGPIAGKVIGFRVDTLWTSWDWASDEWMKLLVEAGAEVRTWRRAQGIHGEEGAAKNAEYAEFVGSADVIISGLGNCGSCTAWTIKDAMSGLATGVPSMAVVTEQFDGLGQILAQDGGHPGLRRHVLPYPLDTLPEDEVRQIARDSFPAMLKTLGAEA